MHWTARALLSLLSSCVAGVVDDDCVRVMKSERARAACGEDGFVARRMLSHSEGTTNQGHFNCTAFNQHPLTYPLPSVRATSVCCVLEHRGPS